MRPEQFDVIVTTNLFGDIIPTLRGPGRRLHLAPGANIGTEAAILRPSTARPDIGARHRQSVRACAAAWARMPRPHRDGRPGQPLAGAIIATPRGWDTLTPTRRGSGSTLTFAKAIASRLWAFFRPASSRRRWRPAAAARVSCAIAAWLSRRRSSGGASHDQGDQQAGTRRTTLRIWRGPVPTPCSMTEIERRAERGDDHTPALNRTADGAVFVDSTIPPKPNRRAFHVHQVPAIAPTATTPSLKFSR